MHTSPFKVCKDSSPGISSTTGQIFKVLQTAGLISLYKQNVSGEVAPDCAPKALIAAYMLHVIMV